MLYVAQYDFQLEYTNINELVQQLELKNVREVRGGVTLARHGDHDQVNQLDANCILQGGVILGVNQHVAIQQYLRNHRPLYCRH
jgi:hypothetical protein